MTISTLRVPGSIGTGARQIQPCSTDDKASLPPCDRAANLEPPVGAGFPEDFVKLVAKTPARPLLPEDPDQRVLDRTAVLVHHPAGRDQRRTGDDDVAELGPAGTGRARKAQRRAPGRTRTHDDPTRSGVRDLQPAARSSPDRSRRCRSEG